MPWLATVIGASITYSGVSGDVEGGSNGAGWTMMATGVEVADPARPLHRASTEADYPRIDVAEECDCNGRVAEVEQHAECQPLPRCFDRFRVHSLAR